MTIQSRLPRWRGFNLLGGFTMRSPLVFPEDQFRWLSDWGFNFARLPLCYTLWTKDNDPFTTCEDALLRIDEAVALGEKHGVHVCLSFHRGPGYSVNPERTEPFNLWTDPEALRAFSFQWQALARRYRGVSSAKVSFNLVNEPADFGGNGLTRANHETVMRTTADAIRAIDPERLILLDGLAWGNEPCPELADLAQTLDVGAQGEVAAGVAQSCRAYVPHGVSHYKASWAGGDNLPEPTWPLKAEGDARPWDKERLREFYAPWIELARNGVGVHCGEGGAHNRTPHPVLLAWFRDVLEVLSEAGIGYAMWNLIGSFGVLDSGRSDVDYEEFEGHKLDRALLSLLQEF